MRIVSLHVADGDCSAVAENTSSGLHRGTECSRRAVLQVQRFERVCFTALDSGSHSPVVATALWAATEPSAAVDVEPDEYEYAVHVYDADREQTLVAAIELVSPANKDRPEKRNSFVAKCAGLLKQGVSVCVVDLVTIRQFNLYTELMTFLGQGRADPMSTNPPPTYAASCRWGPRGEKTRLETWSRVMTVGQPLPSLPLWLREDLVISLDLEASYAQTCYDLWIE